MGEVKFELRDKVAIVTVSAPEVKNGLTAEMATTLREICHEINENLSLGAAVIKGDNGTFCSGADTRAWGANLDPASEEAYARTTAIYGAFIEVGVMKVPTVAAIRGAAVGAGMNLALATDLRIVSETARLIAGFMRIGIHPGGGFFTLMGRSPGGREAAAALGLFAEELSGKRAAELGIAWKALPDDQVEDAAIEVAEKAAVDPELTRSALRTLRNELGPPAVSWEAAVQMERGIQMWSQRRRQQRI